MNENENHQECCPEFNPGPWDKVVLEWNNKLFIKDKVSTFFYMPLNFGKVMIRLDKILKSSNTSCPDYLCLSEHVSKWRMNMYLAVNQEIKDVENIKMSGKFYSKVYEGAFNKTGEWCKDFEKELQVNNYKMDKMYMWYTTCPKCAKKYGKNYVVILGKLSQ